jgi:hypothetical protein
MRSWDEQDRPSAAPADRTRVLWFLRWAAQLAGDVATAEEAVADAFDHLAGHRPEPRARWLRLKAAEAREFASHERRVQQHWLELRDTWRDALRD